MKPDKFHLWMSTTSFKIISNNGINRTIENPGLLENTTMLQREQQKI
ncbi:unnamed protein product [Paramecium primaurelia]|uniref:Uncharacterized protein n=1 Tax=Paramecium primaurelia TaxID=5886 RepID=A0A8S1M2H7_PARPR|nr:unnamed protein product [Paramecium primaurelia]